MVPMSPPWVQTTQVDFNAGTNKTNIVITNILDGEVQLSNNETLDQSQTSDNKEGVVNSSQFEAQTFVAGQTGKLVKFTIKVKKNSNGANPQPLIVDLRNVVSGNPGGTILASTEIPSGSFTGTMVEYNFIFSTPANVVSGNSYALVIRENGTANYSIGYQQNDKYNFGIRLTSSDGGSTWTKVTNNDEWFKAFVGTYLSPGTITSQPFSASTIAEWQSLAWTGIKPAGTDITLAVFTSSDGLTWTDWPLLTSNTSPIDLSFSSFPETRYIKWKATLSTADNTQTPVLHDVTVSYYPGAASQHIVLNEILPNPSGTNPDYGFDFGEDNDLMPKGEWVEIYNKAGGRAVDLAGWYIKDQEGNIINITNSNTNTGSTVIGANGSGNEWIVVYMNKEILNNDGDTVYLYDMFGNLIDSYSYAGDVPGNKSFARIPDGTGPWYDPIPTPGGQNELGDVVIDEQPTVAPDATTSETAISEAAITPETSAPETTAEATTTEAIITEATTTEATTVEATITDNTIITEPVIISETPTEATTTIETPIIETTPAETTVETPVITVETPIIESVPVETAIPSEPIM